MMEVAAFITTMNFFASLGKVGDSQCLGRDDETGKNVDMIADDELLCQTLGGIRRAGVILAQEHDLLAGDHIAMLLHVQLDAIVHLRGRIGELAGVGHDQPDLDGLLRMRRR